MARFALCALGFAEIQELLWWCKKFVTDVAMMSRGAVLRHVVGVVEHAGAPVETELVANEPTNTHSIRWEGQEPNNLGGPGKGVWGHGASEIW